MAKILDRSVESELAEPIQELIDDLGFSPEEAIPALIAAVITLADYTDAPDQALDEAANILADA